MTDASETPTVASARVARPRRKVREGIVVSDKMDKTVVVLVEELKPHPLYKKVVRHRKRFKAHDETNACRVGDRVQLMETRPLSKEKRWRVAAILEKAK
jgi:small subunit ribosomal protein S17